VTSSFVFLTFRLEGVSQNSSNGGWCVVDRTQLHVAARVWGVQHEPSANVDGDVMNGTAEEEKVSNASLAEGGHPHSDCRLVSGLPRQDDAHLAVDELRVT
jgi:hypothetical protein